MPPDDMNTILTGRGARSAEARFIVDGVDIRPRAEDLQELTPALDAALDGRLTRIARGRFGVVNDDGSIRSPRRAPK
jgi:hypothetical protein